MELFINKKIWSNFNEYELENYINNVFNYYKAKGYPYYPTDKSYRDKEFNNLKNYNFNNILENKIIKQTMHGLALAWSYFPHANNVKCNNKLSPLEAFNDDNLLRKIITKRINIGDNMSDSGLRKMIKLFSGVQSVSNFRPTASASIYNKYAKNGTVYDMSGGYGGRFLGATIANIHKYICTEPCELTYDGLMNLSNDYKNNMIVEIHKKGSEDFLPESKSLDLCFTSPPYFDCEKYSDEHTQSYIKFPEKELWLNGFLKKTFENCYYGLKDDAFMIINISNTKNYNSMEKDTIKTAEQCGFLLHETLKLSLSNPNMKNKIEKFKYEPVFIFKKLS